MQYKKFILQTLQETANIANGAFGKTSGVVKKEDSNQILTKTDLEIGNFIISRIEGIYPQRNIIDEETGAINKNSDLTWVIDPIDGTSIFAAGVPLYGAKIGLLKGDLSIAGGISLPALNKFCNAEKGSGYFSEDKNFRSVKRKN